MTALPSSWIINQGLRSEEIQGIFIWYALHAGRGNLYPFSFTLIYLGLHLNLSLKCIYMGYGESKGFTPADTCLCVCSTNTPFIL